MQDNHKVNQIMVIGISLAMLFYMLYVIPISSSLSLSSQKAFAQELSNNMTNLSTNYTSTNISPEVKLLGTEQGQIIGQRILEVQPFPKIEISFKANAVFGGKNGTDIRTVWVVMKPDGTHYGEGKGIHSADNGEVATWTSHGIENVTPDGKSRFHGSVFYNTNSRVPSDSLITKLDIFTLK